MTRRKFLKGLIGLGIGVLGVNEAMVLRTEIGGAVGRFDGIVFDHACSGSITVEGLISLQESLLMEASEDMETWYQRSVLEAQDRYYRIVYTPRFM